MVGFIYGPQECPNPAQNMRLMGGGRENLISREQLISKSIGELVEAGRRVAAT